MPAGSVFPPVDPPVTDLWNFLFNRNDRSWPDDKVMYQDADSSRHYTHAQVQHTALEFGKGLKAVWDWKKGDVLNLFTPNSIDTPPVTWGTHWAGGIVSPANPGYTVDELAYQLKDSGARAVVTQVPMLAVAKAACKKVGIADDMICLVGDERDPEGRIKHFTSIRNISGATRFRKAKIDPKKDLAFLVYSSGTTGTPKGVELSHYNIVANILQSAVGEGRKLNSDDRILACLPFFHIYGLTCLIHNAMYNGFTLVVMPRFEIERWCSLVQEYKITFSFIVPPIALLLSKHPVATKYDLSSLRMLNCGAAPLTRELVEAVHKRLNLKVKQGYGLSETSPVTHTQPWEDWHDTIGSVGKMLPNMTARYMTSPEDGSEPKEVKTGEVGELYMKGPNIFLGYHNRPRETAECLNDGWFRTGDVGYQDENANFFITDRVKELIKYKGFQVPPAELEGYLVDHELVDDVAVVGVQSEALGTEVPRAYVVRSGGGSKAVQKGDDEKIISWLGAKVSNHKKLRGGVKFVDEIPKSASGKILRRLLKNQAKEEYEKQEAAQIKAKL